jgi:carbon-monoxide dehydrogenase large subunit
MPASTTSFPKIDAFSFVGGEARYVDDLRPPALLHMAVVRSTRAHARIMHLDTAAAMGVPGVVRVLAGPEVATHLQPLPYSFGDPQLLGGRRRRFDALPVDEVRYVGEPIAVVAAENVRAALAGAAAVTAEYADLPAFLDARVFLDGQASGPPEELRSHVVAENRFSSGDVTAAFAAAEHQLRLSFSMQRSSAAPIEPRGYLASWDESTGRLTVHASHQQPFQLREQLAQVMGLAEEAVRIVVPRVGGAFGLKMTGPVEEPLVCLMSRLCQRPVKWIESRAECFLGGGREQYHDVRVAFDGSGRVQAIRDDLVVPIGAESPAPGWRQAFVSAATFPTAYDVPNVEIRSLVVATNEPPWHSIRGFGKEGPVLVMERVMDLVARQLGRDPADVRRTNLVPREAIPHRMPSGYLIDSGDFHAVLDEALALADYERLRVQVRTAGGPDLLEGVGMAFEVVPEGGGHAAGRLTAGVAPTAAAPESATVCIDASGHVQVLSGVTNPGGGNDTALALLAAAELGASRSMVTVVQGDTDRCPPGTGNASSRATSVGGAAVVLAAREVAGELRRSAAAMAGVPAERVVLRDGAAHLPAGEEVSLAELCRGIVAEGRGSSLSATRSYQPKNLHPGGETDVYRYSYPYFSSGGYVARVAVDPRTGTVVLRGLTVVHDCGRVIDEVLVEGQLQGAMAMGVGLALLESWQADPYGALTTRSFKEYLVARAPELPSFTIGHHAVPTPNTLLGSKGAGESGVGGALAAVVNAVDDALSRAGAPPATTFPLDPPRVLALLAGGGEAP